MLGAQRFAAGDQRRADLAARDRLGEQVHQILRHVAAVPRVNIAGRPQPEPVGDALGRIDRAAELGREAVRSVGEQPQHRHGVDCLGDAAAAGVRERKPARLRGQVEGRTTALDGRRNVGHLAAADQDRGQVLGHFASDGELPARHPEAAARSAALEGRPGLEPPAGREESMNRFGAIAAAALLAFASVFAVQAQEKISDGVVKIGMIEDMSSLYADITGIGAVTAARMAAEDFGGKVLGKPIEVISADHQNKADNASTIAREWFDTQHVDALMDVAASATALAAIEVAKNKNKIVVLNGPAAVRITNEACTPVSV